MSNATVHRRTLLFFQSNIQLGALFPKREKAKKLEIFFDPVLELDSYSMLEDTYFQFLTCT